MAEVSWVKLKVNTFDDKKIKLILSQKDGDKTMVIFFKIFCFSGEVNDNGYIYLDKKKPLTDEELAEIILEDTVTLRNAFVTLREHNILVRQEENGHFLLRNFMKHQNVEGLEKIKTKGAERAKRYRERIKGLLKQEEPLITIKEGSVTDNVTDNVTVTSRHAIDIDIKNKSKNKNKDKSKSVTDFPKDGEKFSEEQDEGKECKVESSPEIPKVEVVDEGVVVKKDFVECLVEIFEEEYLRHKNIPYVSGPIDKKQMGMMLGKLKKLLPGLDTEGMEIRARELFGKAAGITEDKFYADITIAKLNSQFNQYINFLKNGFKQNRGTGITAGSAGKFEDIERKILARAGTGSEQGTGEVLHTTE